MKDILLALLITFSWGASCFCQETVVPDSCQQVMDKENEKLFKKARNLQKDGKKNEALAIYENILEAHPDYLEVNYYYALSYYLPIKANNYHAKAKDKSDLQKALSAFGRMFDVCPYYKPQCCLYAARLAYFNELFPESLRFAYFIVDNPDLYEKANQNAHEPDWVEEARVIIRKSVFFHTILNHPVPFDPKPVAGISTPDDEYLGTLSPDGELFYFTRRKDVADTGPFSHGEKITKEFFSVSERQGNAYSMGEPLPEPFNKSLNEGSPTVNITNDLMIFTKLVSTTNGYYNYDLYYSERTDEGWSEPKSLGTNINGQNSWESQASLSSDGKLLFFASDRPGGLGGADIWYSQRNSDGSWRKPVNLGPTINTEKDERSPFLHTDSKTLYFSSNGHDGLGGQDIFYSKLDEKNQWSKPYNLGYPINSENDEVNFFVSLDGKTGYFSSNNIDNADWNIYQFELYEGARPHTMMIVKGKVSSDDGDLHGATVEVRDTASNVVSQGIVNAETGNYAVAAEVKQDSGAPVIVTVKKEGHTYDSQIITPEQQKTSVVTKDTEIKPIETGTVCNLKDIYYETNSFTLTKNSKIILSLFIDFLRSNPTVKVEIQGHTDNVGNDEANMKLSEQRAKAVYDYVVEKGIPAERMRYKGYGKTKPVADNSTAAGRSKNRRTVFLIYEK